MQKVSNPVGATTVGRVTHRLSLDKPLKAQGAPEIVAPLPSCSDRLKRNLGGEDLPQHLARLDGLPAKHACYVVDPGTKLLSDLIYVQNRDPRQPLKPSEVRREVRLPGLLGT